MNTKTRNPQIYVADLAAYNAGKLKGIWIDATWSKPEILEEICHHINGDWRIDDCSGFYGISATKYDLEEISKIANGIKEHGEAFYSFVEHYGADIEGDKFDEAYCGCYTSQESFVEEMLEERGTTEKVEAAGLKSYYIDYERIARDWFVDDYFSHEAGYERHHIFHRI